MQIRPRRLGRLAFVAGFAVLAFSGLAGADPPSRAARLGYMTGGVSFSPAGENDWIEATLNRPLTIGDRLWADAGARAEIQAGTAMIRMNGGTGVSVLNLHDRITQLQLTQGTLNIRVRRLEPEQVFEVDTPNLAFTLRQPGQYRIEVEPEGNATTIVVRKGQGEVFGEDDAYVVDSRQPYRFTGTALREYEYVDAPRIDEFDRWSSDRDRRYDNSISARYVSQDVVGYQDLDANGTWRVDATYGNVWIPTRVAAGWAPYRDGHWAWVDPWGWTWVDDAPWGFAVSHYGRWTSLGGTWVWVPGPVQSRAYYAPALVAFVSGNGFQLTMSSGNVEGVAWFPLGPREVYRPSYAVSRGYFENINRSNTVINTTVINNYYDNSNVTNVAYVNRQVPGAIIAVPTTAFVQSQAVSRMAVRVSAERIDSASVDFVPTVTPTERSVRGAASQGGKPPARLFERAVIARTTPPAAHVGFSAQQQQLAARPGKPLDDAARGALRPAAAAPAPAVKVLAQRQEAPPTIRPPRSAPDVRPGEARGKTDARQVPAAAPAISRVPDAPGAPTQGGSPVQALSPAPVGQPPEQHAKPDARGNGEARRQAVTASPAPPQRATPPYLAPSQRTAQPAPAAQSAESRGKPEERANGKQQGRVLAAPPAPPQQAAAPYRAMPPHAAPPAPQSAEPRVKPEQRGNSAQRVQPTGEPSSSLRPSEPTAVPPPVAAPALAAQHSAPVIAPGVPPAQPRQMPRAEPRGEERKAPATKRDDNKGRSGEQKQEEDNPKHKE